MKFVPKRATTKQAAPKWSRHKVVYPFKVIFEFEALVFAEVKN